MKLSELVRVAILDEVAVTRAGLADLLSRVPHCQIVATGCPRSDPFSAATGIDVLVLALHEDPDATTLATVAGWAGQARVLVAMAPQHVPRWAGVLLKAGALGLVSTHAPQREIAAATATVAGGGMHVCAEAVVAVGAELTRQPTPPPPVPEPGLSAREVEALRHVAGGLTHAQTARRMGLSPATVNYYIGRIRAKLNAGNKAQLATKALALGYLPDHPHSTNTTTSAGLAA